ncbi:SdpI family protein [Spirosoma flavum]|uniref:SdpI family protein n=1 Tax=Spirosoma flavum TaxID=2048557 RepID=A0ABW6AL13_9BACT
MKTNSTSTEILIIASMLAPLAYLALVWNQLPAEIATHYDLNGNPNDWVPRQTAAICIGSLSALLYVVLRFMPAIDPKGQLQTLNYQKLRFVITLFFAAIMGWVFYMASHPADGKLSTGMLLALVGLLLAGMGNYMTTIKPNWFVGIRTRWTLQSESVWRKTHRMGGRLMVVGGLLSAILALVVPMPYTIGVVVSLLLAVAIIPVIYSYVYFRQEKAHQLN